MGPNLIAYNEKDGKIHTILLHIHQAETRSKYAAKRTIGKIMRIVSWPCNIKYRRRRMLLSITIPPNVEATNKGGVNLAHLALSLVSSKKIPPNLSRGYLIRYQGRRIPFINPTATLVLCILARHMSPSSVDLVNRGRQQPH